MSLSSAVSASQALSKSSDGCERASTAQDDGYFSQKYYSQNMLPIKKSREFVLIIHCFHGVYSFRNCEKLISKIVFSDR